MEKGKTMGKSRRGVGVLLAFVLVIPAPALTACFGSEVAKESERIAAQRARDIAKRAGPGVGAGGVGGAGWCVKAEDCP
jgi:hypothetical protein